MTVPVFIGRHVMGLWMGQGAVVHELYTGACGLYICWLVLRLGSVMMTWVPHGLELLMVKVREYALLVGYSYAIKSVITCISLLFFILHILFPAAFQLQCLFMRPWVHRT